MFIRRKAGRRIRAIIPLLISAIVVYAIIAGTVMTKGQADEQAQKMTYENIRRAAVQCYALEGVYPVSIDYLIDHYGIRPDTQRFVIHYQFIAENLLPDIAVIPINR